MKSDLVVLRICLLIVAALLILVGMFSHRLQMVGIGASLWGLWVILYILSVWKGKKDV